MSPAKNKTLLIVLLLFSVSVAFGQAKIKGTVVDATTEEPLAFANVFINNTTVGANCDDFGKFKLSKVGLGEHELVVSFVGHQNYQTKIVVKDTATITLFIRLVPLEIKAVEVVGTRDKEWEKQFEKFKKLFVGEGLKDTDVRIVNRGALNFNEENDVFSASASEKLEVENFYLGYNIEYELRSFLVSPVAYNIVGFVRYREMETADPAVVRRWNENRLKSYRGSYRHLFKSIIDANVEQAGFVLYEDISKGQPRTSNLLWANIDKFITRHNVEGTLTKDKGIYKLKLPNRLEVHYKKKSAPAKYYKDASYPISWIETTTGYVNLDENGSVLNFSAMVLSGDMTQQRVGEMLPRDYVPTAQDDEPVIPVASYNPYVNFIEKPYLQTDRSYYYHNDVLWFKAYVNYANWSLKDSLSHVLTVELIGPGNDLVARKFVRIVNGAGLGSIDLPNTIAPGLYQLRAYSRWQLNFSPTMIFTRPVRLLASYEIVERTGQYQIIPGDIKLQLDKQKFITGDSIRLTITLPQPMAANLSVAVTDISQGLPPTDEITIQRSFAIEPSDTVGLPKSPKYILQGGIDIAGKMVDAKGGPQEGMINVLEKKSGMMMAAATGKNGEFVFSNLDFSDSLEFIFQPKPINKKVATVSLTPFFMPAVGPTPALQLKVVRTNDPNVNRWRPSPFEKAEMLPEVTVESQRLEDSRAPIKKMANFSISGEWLRKNNVRNIASALQIRVPGLSILTFYDGKSLPYRVVMFQMRHVSFFPGGPLNTSKEDMLQKQEPIILINDAVVNYQLGDGASALENLRPEQVERIDVYRSNAYGNYGPRGGNGVIAIYTRNPMEYATPKSVDIPVQRIKLAGYSSSRKFGEVLALSEAKNRATVWWAPSITVNVTGKALITFPSASAGIYRIVVEGVSSDGTPLRGEMVTQVAEK